ncbi:AAA family ATPase [Streptomyces zingiberis]|uniref:AAA family ATPase n=1 Tax=Streptomyces zingiberis TaxID=2053010 RepID=A0ABX1BTW7_9ACTN|nr:LuxR family transcriptional regulator [Streptomyces zingiberis]NJP99892.1 AAA family ATPase [Streptomyces zingiberis]
MRTPVHSSGRLYGRHEETCRIDELTAAARKSRGGALVLRGEAGIGKSALLDHARRTASGFLVIEASGSEGEAELPFAALHQLCLPVLGHLAALPAQRREALQVAFGLTAGVPDEFRMGLAALELLAAAARERPLLCLVDDGHWLDAASSKALAFLARRISAEPVAMLLAVRPPSPAGELDALPGLSVGGLNDTDARALLSTKARVPLDEQVRRRIVAESRGNPLALLELPRAGGYAPPGAPSVPTRIERGFQQRLRDLPEEARLLLTIASADPTGDPGLLWPAALRLDLDVTETGAAAAATGLVDFSTRVRFCHPLARSAVYRAAGARLRRTAHRVLGEVTDPVLDPDRRAWHRAEASAGPDEDVAEELERSASRARSRGGAVAAAAFAERAAALSLDTARRIERTLAAVQAHLDAGSTDTAAELLATVESAPLDELRHVRVDLLRGKIAFVRHTDGDGPMFMLRAAHRLAALDPQRSRECFLDAVEMSMAVGRSSGVLDTVLAAARTAAPAGATHAPDLLDVLALLAEERHREAVPLVRKLLSSPPAEAGDGGGDGTGDGDGPLWRRRPALAVMLASEVWDPHTQAAITDWLIRTGEESGSPLVLRLGLAPMASLAAVCGDLARAATAIAEEEAIADAFGGPPVFYHRLHLAAMRGRREAAAELFATATAEAAERGTGQIVAHVHWAAAVLNNGLADYPAALAAARRAAESGELYLAGFALPELVEAAVRCGEPDAAAAALASLTERTEAGGTASGLGIAAYARGLVTGAEGHYREAVERLAESPLLPYRARAHLLYGEWLRRRGRRRDGARQLHLAHELLSGAGLEAFARRAADELRAAGERVRGPAATPVHDRLTPQEVSIARLVATGATSKEVATRLFLSPRTIDAHLRNVFRKLGITSRRQLKDVPGLR